MELTNQISLTSGGIYAREGPPGRLSVYFTTTVYISSYLGAGVPDEGQAAFERERAAFRSMLPNLRQHAGQFVAIHDGKVAASDESRNGVIRKFFSEHLDGASVYVGFVGSRPVARVPSPVVVRRH
jgi:hypothetical protein